jgi:hypothetical protein
MPVINAFVIYASVLFASSQFMPALLLAQKLDKASKLRQRRFRQILHSG